MKVLFSSSRLDFRPFDISDAENFFILNQDPEVMRYTGDVAFKNIEDAEKLILNYSSYAQSGFGRWTVIEKETGLIIGWAGLKRLEDECVDLGYRFHKTYWGKGFGTEAALACLKYGFEVIGLDEIIGRTAKDNFGSIRVLEKSGMSFWKTAPCEGIENSVYYKITKDEFNEI